MSDFFWIGNHPGLDFVNTAAADDRGKPIELLPDYASLTSWLDKARLVPRAVPRAVPTHERARLLGWARRLRTAAHDVLDPRPKHASRARAALDAVVAEVPVRLAYAPATSAAVPVEAATPADRVRLALAITVLEATALDRSRVRRCGRPGCVLLFFDTSKNGTRRWCDMAVCGNRVKAAAHYRRQRGNGSPDT